MVYFWIFGKKQLEIKYLQGLNQQLLLHIKATTAPLSFEDVTDSELQYTA